MIQGFDYKDQMLGDSVTTVYTFDFKIYDPSHLHLYIQDTLGNIVSDTDGTDPTVVAGLVFDTVNGGGTITLASPLGNSFVMTIFLANDAPDQPTAFPNKSSFSLDAIEGALDFLASWGQRIAYLAQRALRLHDLDDIDSFDMRLPINASTYPNSFLQVNAAGNGWLFGPTYAQILSSIEASIALTLGGFIHAGPFASIAPGFNLNLPNETTDSTKYTQVDYVARIRRGSTVYARQEFSIFYRGGAWEIAMGSDLFADIGSDHGVTFTVNAVSGQINAAVANDGGSNAIIDVNKIYWTV